MRQSNECGWRCIVCDERRVGRVEGQCWREMGCAGLGEGGGWWVDGLRGIVEGVEIWLWCEWERGLRRGCGKN